MPESDLFEKTILLRPGDDVVVAREPLPAGLELGWAEGQLRVAADVPAGHKLAISRVAAGEPVRKYGQVIGTALRPIEPGDWVHTHNLVASAPPRVYEYGAELRGPAALAAPDQRTFDGYALPNDRAGTRNYLCLVSTVNCSADAVQALARRLEDEVLPDFPHVDGVVAVTHLGGCGMPLGGADHRILQRSLAGMAQHPNVAGTLVVGLGCEVNQAAALVSDTGLISPASIAVGRPAPPAVLNIQQSGGVRRTVEEGLRLALPLLRRADRRRRTALPLSRLVVGTNCGGSDAASGITANPALGEAGDEFVRQGAGWVLAETPETYGAEHLLTRRASPREVGEKLVALMRWWEDYTARHDAVIDNNPAPGNKEGGLTTILEKSLGAVMKAGTSPLRAVYAYGEPVGARGLSFMDTPGHDPVSVTGLVAGGCQLIAFTTGRGSCLGFRPAPVLKIATTTALYDRMADDMDIDAGVILSGTPIVDVGRAIVEELIAVASGKKTKSEAQGLGANTFAPWTLGPVL